jgi:hypothetical protein
LALVPLVTVAILLMSSLVWNRPSYHAIFVLNKALTRKLTKFFFGLSFSMMQRGPALALLSAVIFSSAAIAYVHWNEKEIRAVSYD